MQNSKQSHNPRIKPEPATDGADVSYQSFATGSSISASSACRIILFCIFLAPGEDSFSTLRLSTLLLTDSSAHQDHCGRFRIRTPTQWNQAGTRPWRAEGGTSKYCGTFLLK